nr:hypothetical protein [Deltaproteobacteria bacterium]
MSHVKPQRWSDAFAGRVAAADRAAMDRHADACSRCASARERVTRASESFGAMRAQTAPELPWDSIRARVHWSVSSELRASQRGERRQGRVWQGLAL